MKIEALYTFPVKSCAPLSVSRFRCTEFGPEWDREWMIVDENVRFITQREIPRLALVQPSLSADALILSAPGMKEITLPLASGAPMEVNIWDQPTAAFSQGNEAARWLSEFLGCSAQLVRITEKARQRTGEDPRSIRFADSYPLHLCSLASLEDLNQRLPSPVEILRFRPNIVLSGASAWAEDHWKAAEIGGNTFRIGKRCERCTITTVDPLKGIRGAEPLKTLASFRRNAKNKIEFGQYLHAVPGAEIALGMEVIPTSPAY